MIEKTKNCLTNQNLKEILNLLVDRFDWLVASDQVSDPVQWFKYVVVSGQVKGKKRKSIEIFIV